MTEDLLIPARETADLAVPALDASLPKYEQLRSSLIAQIRDGQLAPGAAIPPELRLAELFDVARSTVRQAMSSLERDGLVRRIHGKGTFVHDEARERLQQHRGQKLFALIVPETAAGFYPSLQRSFEQSVASLHGQVIVCNSNNDIDKQGNTILQLIDHQVAGVAIVPTTNPATPAFQIRQLQKHGIPVVCCSRRVDGVQAPLLAIPFEDVGRRAGEAMREAGHTRVAMISGDRTVATEAYERGFRDAFRDEPAEIQIYYGHTQNPDISAHEAEMAEALNQFFDHGAPPTAIFASFDSLAELIYMLLARRGLRVPHDVSLISFGGARRQGALARQLTSITIDEDRLGQDAVDLLDAMRRGDLPIDRNDTRDVSLGLSHGATLGRAPRH